jgi:hypothetical protein
MFFCSEAFHRNLDKVKQGTIRNKPILFAGKNIEVNDKNINIVHKGNETPIAITIFTTFDIIENQSLHINQAKIYIGNEADYPFALNTKEPVIVVDKTQNIPYDYEGLLCVPLTFMNNYNSEEFEIIGYYRDYEKDEEKNIELKKKYLIAMEKIKKQLLITPKDEKLLKIINHPMANKIYF